jgi:hypothetical protein
MKHAKQISFILFVSIILILTSCSIFKEKTCESEMEKLRANLGEPEEITTTSSPRLESEDWYYYSQGVSYTFTWGESIGGCEITVRTFTPSQNQQDLELISDK